MIWVLVGHRGTGKTTLGKRVARLLDRKFIDIDQEAKKKTGKTPTELIEASLSDFRQLELDLLSQISGPAIVSPGGGIEKIPPTCRVIWLHRKGWQVSARRKGRVRPDLALEEELRWMEEEREPRYLAWADAKLDMGSEDELALSAERLATLIQQLEASSGTSLMSRSWWIGDRSRWRRQIEAWKMTQTAGIEVRSDRIPLDWKGLRALPAEHRLWSVRTAEAKPLANSLGKQDVDLPYVSSWGQASIDSEWIISSHAKPWEKPVFPKESRHVKWAPHPRSFEDLSRYRSWANSLRSTHEGVTVLPQGRRWTWLRIVEALKENEWNYLSSHALTNEFGTPPWSEWARVSHADSDCDLYGLIGDPVDSSWGGEFHNRFFQTQGLNAIYVLIPMSGSELKSGLEQLYEMGFKGLSVTAPHKRRILDQPSVIGDELVETLGSANTLCRLPEGRWQASSTDVEGMSCMLQALSTSEPSRVLLIGQGGVASAIDLALNDFGIKEFSHVGYRELEPSSSVWRQAWDLVINASGRNVVGGPKPKASLWMDLRYGKEAANDGGKKFLSGENFFFAQARAQLRTWGFKVREKL